MRPFPAELAARFPGGRRARGPGPGDFIEFLVFELLGHGLLQKATKETEKDTNFTNFQRDLTA